jgi:hypothetical protein
MVLEEPKCTITCLGEINLYRFIEVRRICLMAPSVYAVHACPNSEKSFHVCTNCSVA